MKWAKAGSILALLLYSGCTIDWIIGTLPTPDPIFTVAAGENPLREPSCIPDKSKNIKCLSPNERVKIYLLKLLPSSSDELTNSLKGMGFYCFMGDDARHMILDHMPSLTQCTYTKSQPLAPCFTSVRPSIIITFPAQTAEITQHDMTVSTIVVPDPENEDDRGCFPL